MYYLDGDRIFDEFKLSCPWGAAEMVTFERFSDSEMIYTMKDGSVILFDSLMKTYRCADSMSDLYRRMHPSKDEEWAREFSFRLRRLMVENGMTQQDLAYASGISQASVCAYLNGDKTPSTRVLAKMVRALDCSAIELTRLLGVD